MDTVRLRAVGYRRVSMREQIDGHSLDAQEKNIRDYCASQKWDLLEIYIDAGISAKKDSHRPDLERMLQDAEAGKFDVIVVDKVDRFYRHLAGLLTALDQLRGWNVSFASVQERLDFTSPWGKLMLTVLGILAEIYLDNLRQETIKGKQQRARKGLWNGLPSLGYCRGVCSDCHEPNGKDYCPDYGKPNKADGKTLIPHPVDSRAVQQIFAWYLEGDKSDAIIAELLNQYYVEFDDGVKVKVRQQGAPGRTQPGPYTRDVVRDMLKRRFYTGKLPYHPSSALGRRRTKRSEQKAAQIFDGVHPALVSEENFLRVQQLREALGTNSIMKKNGPVRVFPLTGMLRCARCGGSMRGTSNSGNRYYQDATRIEHKEACPQPPLRAERIEEKVFSFIEDTLSLWEKEKPFLDEKRQKSDAEARYERAKELYLAGEITREEMQKEKERYEIVIKRLQDQGNSATLALREQLSIAIENWPSTLPTERKKLFQLTIGTAFVRGKALVAIQPSATFLPLVQGIYRTCGEGGIRTRG